MPKIKAAYDPIADEYANFAATHDDPTTVGGLAVQRLVAVVERFLNPFVQQTICDLGCGEGYLARRLAPLCNYVIGVDISERLLDIARTRTEANNVRYINDDAQQLGKFSNDTIEAVVSNFALMDIADLDATVAAVKRVLKPQGFFIFSLTHPCFQAPHSEIFQDDVAVRIGRKISKYAREGFWRSDNPHGIRGKVGAYHRTLSTYINNLLSTGFTLRYIEEPTLPDAQYEVIGQQVQRQVPSVIVMVAQLSPYPTLPNVP